VTTPEFNEIIDVRSESESPRIIPGAQLPMLNDQQRARVGTIYKWYRRSMQKKLRQW
jgi:tRNA 2-selenouridine synthase SelU